jgi:hypothetical protein
MAIKVSGTTVIDDDRKMSNLRLNSVVITSNTTAVAGTTYHINGSGITLTLPATPSAGDMVGWTNLTSNRDNIINNNGANVMGILETLVLDIAYSSKYVVYTNSTNGWVFVG